MAKKANPFEGIDRELPRWLDEAIASVVRWQWWEGVPTVEPLADERRRAKPTKPLDHEPSPSIGHRRGYDADGNVRIDQGMVMGKPSGGVTVWHRGDGFVQAIDCSAGQPPPRAQQVYTLRPSAEHPMSLIHERADLRWTRTYEHDGGGRIVRIDTIFESPHGKVKETWSETVSYDASGNATVKKVEQTSAAEPIVSREMHKLNKTHAAAVEKLVEKKLIAAVQAAVKRADLDEPAYCLVLAYDNENPGGCLPPMIGIGLEREREAWIQEHGADAADYVWNPAEFENYQTDALELADRALATDCEHLNEAWGESNTAAAIRVLNRVAAALAEAKWPEHFARTEDFVVFATDLECAQGAANRKKSVPAALLKQLKRRGL